MSTDPSAAAATTSGPATGPRLPAVAERLRLPLYQRSQARMAERWGFDFNTPDAGARAEALVAGAPDDAERLVLAAAVRSSRGDDTGALAIARRAVAADAASARAHTTLATLLARNGDVEGASAHAARAAELDPQDPVAVFNHGVIAWTVGDRNAGRADFERAARLLGLRPAPWWRRRRRGA